MQQLQHLVLQLSAFFPAEGKHIIYSCAHESMKLNHLNNNTNYIKYILSAIMKNTT